MSDPYDYPKVCEVCGGGTFYHYCDFGYEYDYCADCNTAYDEEGKIIPEGPEPEIEPEEVKEERPTEGQQILNFLLNHK